MICVESIERGMRKSITLSSINCHGAPTFHVKIYLYHYCIKIRPDCLVDIVTLTLAYLKYLSAAQEPRVSSRLLLCHIVRVDVKGNGDDDVNCHQLHALQPVGFAVLNQIVDNQDGDEHGNGLE